MIPGCLLAILRTMPPAGSERMPPKNADQVFRALGPWWTLLTVKEHLHEMKKAGMISEVGDGYYTCAKLPRF